MAPTGSYQPRKNFPRTFPPSTIAATTICAEYVTECFCPDWAAVERDADFARTIRARKRLDRTTFKIKAHRVIGCVIHDEPGGRTKKFHLGRLTQHRESLGCIGHRRLGQVERNS